jgi:phosphate:Na+ symporter
MDTTLIIFNILGGLALFLYGLFILSTGFKKVFFRKLRDILKKLTKNPLRGAGLGALTTAIIQSSSITVITLIGLLNAGLLNLEQSIGVMLGAEIGTTVTAQVVAFKIGLYYFPLIALGCLLLFFFKNRKIQYVGQIILGFGILFLGIQTMSQGTKALKDIPFLINMLRSFGQTAILGILAGAFFTSIVQSSSATIGLIIAMGIEGVITLPAAIALMLGANIGTCITGFFASLKSCKSAKRLSAAQLTVNISGVAIFALFLLPFSRIVDLTSNDLGRQIANAHTIFNVIVTLTAIPLTKPLKNLVQKIIPGKIVKIERGIKFLDDKILNIPNLAILQAQKEVLRMAQITKEMLVESQKTIFNGNKNLIHVVKEKEASVDELHHLLDNYLAKISTQAISQKGSEKLTTLLHGITDIERVADHANNLAEIAEFKSKHKIAFSVSAKKDLEIIFSKAFDSFSSAIKSLEKNNPKIAQRTLALEKQVNQLEDKMKKNHYKRLRKERCQSEAGPIYLEIISNLERVSDHAENIASGVIMGF